MQLLPLDEKDTLLFNSRVNRTLCALYRGNTEKLTLMWEQQGIGFWLKFCISLRSVLQKQGFCVQLSTSDSSHLDEFFINLAKLLTGKSAEGVHSYIKDVVSIARFHQLLRYIIAETSERRWRTPSYFRLGGSFFHEGNSIKMLGTLPLHLRAVGSLLRLLERWLVPRAEGTSDKALWHVPDSWHHGSHLLASQFEIFLKRVWGSQLFSLLDVSSSDIGWWNIVPKVVISFSNAAFNHYFWYQERGLQMKLSSLIQTHSSSSPNDRVCAAEVNFLLRFISNHLIRACVAIDLNSKFYDTIYGGVTWMSRITLIRLPWNIPLLTNWLEVLLIQIYKFERFFIPLCHFPLRKNIVSLVERMHRKIAEAEFLVKACIIIADGIRKRQPWEPSRCHGPRELLHTVISRLNYMMQFLETDAYRVLEVILNAGWEKKEREDGESCLAVEDRVKVDLSTWNSVPDINKYYSENFRNINYWISDAEWPDIKGGEEFFTEAVDMLRDYQLGCKAHVEVKDPYNFSLFMTSAKSRFPNFKTGFDDPEQYLIVCATIGLLKDDGWVSPLVAADFIAPLGDGKKYFDQYVKLAAVYYVVAFLLGDTWQCKIAGQNALAQLQRNETYAIMADTGARICMLTQSSTGINGCPPARYFEDAAAEIQDCAKDTHLSIEEAMLLLDSFEKRTNKKADVNTDEALTAVKVPLFEEMREPTVGISWLKYLENKRMQLLQLVSVEQFRVTQSYVKSSDMSQVELFPLHDVLEHRLVEEMAAMRKCLELEREFCGPAYGLCRLLAFRFAWIQRNFVQWKRGKHKLKVPFQQVDPKELHFEAVYTRIRMMAALIPLEALFHSYISEYQTTHPINKMTTAMFAEWTEVARVCCLKGEWNNVGSCLREYTEALKEMGCCYVEEMLVHCTKVWMVAPFCTDPEAIVEFGSIVHGQQIVTTFTQLFLMYAYAVLLQKPGIAVVIIQEMEEQLVYVTTILRQMEAPKIDAYQAWPNTRQELKRKLRILWSSLLTFRQSFHIPANEVTFPIWFGNSSRIWQQIFMLFVSSEYGNILHKIAFSEFINIEDPEPYDSSSRKLQNMHKNKTKKSKAGIKIVCAVRGAGVPPAPIPRAEVVKIHNSAGKSNASEKNVQAEENKNQGKQCPSGESLKQGIQFGNGTPSNYKMCTNCKSVESKRRMYKMCSLCKKEKWHHPRFYCSKECQVKDWKTNHSMEHNSAEVE